MKNNQLEKLVTYKPLVIYKKAGGENLNSKIIDFVCENGENEDVRFCSGLSKTLPESVHLLTFEKDSYDFSKVIVRLENISEVDEEVDLCSFRWLTSVESMVVKKVNLAGVEDENSEIL